MEGAVVPAMLIGAHAFLCQTSSWRLLIWGLQPQVFPPAVSHDQQGVAT